jgi:hypothetical protein
MRCSRSPKTRWQHDQEADTYRSALEEQCLYDRHLHLCKSGTRTFVIAIIRHPVARFESLFYCVTRYAYSLNQFHTILETLELRKRVLPHLQSQPSRGNVTVQQAMEEEERMNSTFFQKLTADFHAHVAAEAQAAVMLAKKMLSMQLRDMDNKMWGPASAIWTTSTPRTYRQSTWTHWTSWASRRDSMLVLHCYAKCSTCLR